MDFRLSTRLTAGMVGAALLLSACTTLDPYTREEKTSNVAKGAAIGAAAGAAIGLITGDDSAERKKRALILAGVGAVAGGAESARLNEREKQQVVKNCMRGRGYRVLN